MQPFTRVGVGQVGRMSGDLGVVLAPDLAGRVLQRRLATRDDDDAGTLRREGVRDRQADPLRAAADEDPLAFQPKIHAPLLLPAVPTPALRSSYSNTPRAPRQAS